MTPTVAAPRCACCGSDASALQHRLSLFDVYRCAACTLLFRHPLPMADSLEELYEDETYHDGAYFRNTALDYDLSAPEIRIYRAALAHLARLAPGGRLLDVGCGRGVFLDLARKEGFAVSGVELSTRHVRWARERFGLDVCAAEFLSSGHAPGGYDVVTMWDFLEHVLDPVAVLRRARELLAPRGILLVFTIDTSSLFNLVGAALARLSLGLVQRPLELLYDVHHNFYFTRTSLEKLLLAQGFASEAWYGHRAYLGRWLNEPAPVWLRAGGAVLDGVGSGIGRPYRRTAICRRD
jgi:2-polyprenyl-3-methyl-5-hydroxy-6-metoxy-1,4-benzoquinol methylase